MVDITLASACHEQDILPLMIAFNAAEHITWQPETMASALRELLQRSELGFVLLARDSISQACVGYSVATHGFDIEFSGADAFITELFVEQSFRGRGIGRELLEAAICALRERGSRAVHLLVRPENQSARSLYDQSGFQVVPRLLMTKSLVNEE